MCVPVNRLLDIGQLQLGDQYSAPFQVSDTCVSLATQII